jgi:uncharacterized lipoprotein YmbA
MKGMIVMLPLALAGCAQTQPAQQAHPIGMANPASVTASSWEGNRFLFKARRACAPSASYPVVKR